MRQQDLLIRYCREMLTPAEAKDVIYYNSLTTTLSLSYLFLWVPVSFAFYAKYRQDRIANAPLRFRIMSIHAIQLPVIIYAQNKKNTCLEQLERKYLNDLSDYEIQNFDVLFQ